MLNSRPVTAGYNMNRLGTLTTGQVGDITLANLVLTPTDVNVGVNKTVLSVHCQDYTTCAILDDASVLCWGVPQHPRTVPS